MVVITLDLSLAQLTAMQYPLDGADFPLSEIIMFNGEVICFVSQITIESTQLMFCMPCGTLLLSPFQDSQL